MPVSDYFLHVTAWSVFLLLQGKHWLIQQTIVPLPNNTITTIDNTFRNRYMTDAGFNQHSSKFKRQILFPHESAHEVVYDFMQYTQYNSTALLSSSNKKNKAFFVFV